MYWMGKKITARQLDYSSAGFQDESLNKIQDINRSFGVTPEMMLKITDAALLEGVYTDNYVCSLHGSIYTWMDYQRTIRGELSIEYSEPDIATQRLEYLLDYEKFNIVTRLPSLIRDSIEDAWNKKYPGDKFCSDYLESVLKSKDRSYFYKVEEAWRKQPVRDFDTEDNAVIDQNFILPLLKEYGLIPRVYRPITCSARVNKRDYEEVCKAISNFHKFSYTSTLMVAVDYLYADKIGDFYNSNFMECKWFCPVDEDVSQACQRAMAAYLI